MSEVSDYAAAVAKIRADYERRLENARRAYDACRETLEIEHDRALRAEAVLADAVGVLGHATLGKLFGEIEDSGTRESDKLMGLVRNWIELRDDIFTRWEPSEEQLAGMERDGENKP